MMTTIQEISPKCALVMVETQKAILVDIRKERDFYQSHPVGAVHLNSDNIAHCLNQWQHQQPIIIICYHGISSRQIAHYFVSQGFENVYSLQGGMAEWKKAHLPVIEQ